LLKGLGAVPRFRLQRCPHSPAGAPHWPWKFLMPGSTETPFPGASVAPLPRYVDKRAGFSPCESRSRVRGSGARKRSRFRRRPGLGRPRAPRAVDLCVGFKPPYQTGLNGRPLGPLQRKNPEYFVPTLALGSPMLCSASRVRKLSPGLILSAECLRRRSQKPAPNQVFTRPENRPLWREQCGRPFGPEARI